MGSAMKATYTAVFDQGDDGYTVTVPALPGLVTEGRTVDEAREMAIDAIRCYLESLRKDGEPIPTEVQVNIQKLEVDIPAA